ncbi:MAG: hypothetical protein CL908_13355 [Deltaproteobacteria bacterium]|nr:hypothetical protein [Deltaproteobacteria bacterium]
MRMARLGLRPPAVQPVPTAVRRIEAGLFRSLRFSTGRSILPGAVRYMHEEKKGWARKGAWVLTESMAASEGIRDGTSSLVLLGGRRDVSSPAAWIDGREGRAHEIDERSRCLDGRGR